MTDKGDGEAAVLAKVMMIGDPLRLNRRARARYVHCFSLTERTLERTKEV